MKICKVCIKGDTKPKCVEKTTKWYLIQSMGVWVKSGGNGKQK